MLELLDVEKARIHDPNELPFAFAWTDQTDTEFERGFVSFHWRNRASVGRTSGACRSPWSSMANPSAPGVSTGVATSD